MVTFVSLFLWLMTSTHTVQVAVDPEVASIEIFLDDHSLGTVDGPPWQVECDFGTTLRPHELVAVARDKEGRELDRAVQLVNLPRPRAEVQIVFEMGVSGVPETVKVITESSEKIQPLAVFVTFDGVGLTRGAGGIFKLPPFIPGLVHIVSAEAYFPGGFTARQDMTFGGTYGSRVATELTAVAVVTDEKRFPGIDDLQSLFSVRDVPVRVAAVERPGVRVYMVRDQGAWPFLQRMGSQGGHRSRKFNRRTRQNLGDNANDPTAGANLPPERDRFHLVVANPSSARGLALFPVGSPLDIKHWSLPWLATHISNQEASVGGQRLAEAVAVAGVRAAGDGCPRVVILVLSANPVDGGGHGAEAVRDYLRALNVPLAVWSVAGGEDDGRWGRAENISDPGKLGKASKRLMKDLERQWIVWVEGRHLPSAIALGPNSHGLRLAE